MMSESIGDRLRGILDKVGGYLREALPDRPETVPLKKIDQSAVVAAYQRWLNFPTVMRLVRKENHFPDFTLPKILWALGYLEANQPDQFSNPKGRAPDFQKVHARVHQVLSQLEREEIIDGYYRSSDEYSDPNEIRKFRT